MTPTIIEQVKEALECAADALYGSYHDGERQDCDACEAVRKAREALALLDQLPPPMTEAEKV